MRVVLVEEGAMQRDAIIEELKCAFGSSTRDRIVGDERGRFAADSQFAEDPPNVMILEKSGIGAGSGIA